MSREIKFRAWAPQNKKMSYPMSLSDIGIADFQGDSLFDKEKTFNSCIWLQYTGLKDKNGVEIYEGDILKSPDEDFNYCLCEWNVKNGCFQINGYGKEMYLNEGSGEEYSDGNKLIEDHVLVLGGDNELEVIGNIYQNPELLNA